MSNDLLAAVKSELSRSEPLQYLEHYIIADWLRALVAEVERLHAELHTQKHNAVAGLMAAAEFAAEDEARLKVRAEKAEAALAALRQRHEAARAVLDSAGVEFEDQRISYTTIQVDRAAWEAWKAKEKT